MVTLTEDNLIKAIQDIKKLTDDRENSIAIKPTKFLVYKYSYETPTEYLERVNEIKKLIKGINANKT